MPVPEEYTNAINALKAFRTKILTALVGGRVKAGLDASHDSMVKFSGVIDGISVTPYMFGKVKEKALALRLKNKDLGVGKIKLVKGEYVGGKANYPLKEPYQVPQRPLPQVDVFAFTPLKDIELLEETDSSALRSFILVQAPSGTFEETGDAENALYDYYEMHPQWRRRGVWEVVTPNPAFSTLHHIEGEEVLMARQLVVTGTMNNFEYNVEVWLDVGMYTETDLLNANAILTKNSKDEGAPSVHISIVGQKVSSDDVGLWGAHRYSDALHGHLKHANEITVTPTPEKVWVNTFPVTVEVNDPLMGTTDPPPDTYTREAQQPFSITAVPNAGYHLDHWERDGVTISTDVTYIVKVTKAFEIEAVLVPD